MIWYVVEGVPMCCRWAFVEVLSCMVVRMFGRFVRWRERLRAYTFPFSVILHFKQVARASSLWNDDL